MRPALLCLAIILLATGCAIPRWPVEGTVTSPFGIRRDGFRLELHRGIDIAVPTGTPVRAMAPGRVAFAGTMSGYGHVVILDHGGVRTLYAHLSEISVRRNQEIRGREVIGLSGSTGRSSGPHLHFEILRGRRAEDPVPLLGGFPRPRVSR
ncbi:MAG: M23 family metallopeptidase [Gemmatimonadota bacterium]